MGCEQRRLKRLTHPTPVESSRRSFAQNSKEISMSLEEFKRFVPEFDQTYDEELIKKVWEEQSDKFNKFWNERIISPDTDSIPDDDCDQIIRILDRNGKGNTKGSEAIAKAMVSQGAWRRLFNILHKNKALGALVNGILTENNSAKRADLIDLLFHNDDAKRINLIGPTGNTISLLLAASNPSKFLSITSLRDREKLIDFLAQNGLTTDAVSDQKTIGKKIVDSHNWLITTLQSIGITGDARKISRYCYFEPVRQLWRKEYTVGERATPGDKPVTVVIPPSVDETDVATDAAEVRESIKIQAMLAKIGEALGFEIWIPKPDRAKVAQVWQPKDLRCLLDTLPLSYDSKTLSSIELIDVIWISNRRSIARAFEVEHTTSVYSGILRMADLVALQPNIRINMHIVAPVERMPKFLSEIRRPVFAYMAHGSLADMCSFISYDDVRDLANSSGLAYFKDRVLEQYEVRSDDEA